MTQQEDEKYTTIRIKVNDKNKLRILQGKWECNYLDEVINKLIQTQDEKTTNTKTN